MANQRGPLFDFLCRLSMGQVPLDVVAIHTRNLFTYFLLNSNHNSDDHHALSTGHLRDFKEAAGCTLIILGQHSTFAQGLFSNVSDLQQGHFLDCKVGVDDKVRLSLQESSAKYNEFISSTASTSWFQQFLEITPGLGAMGFFKGD